MFEGVYSVERGVSYNSYLLSDEKTVLFDTVDKAVSQRFLENLEEALNGRQLDYIVISHLEPDHSASLKAVVTLYPGAKIVCNQKTLNFIKQFYDFDADSRALVVNESTELRAGKHCLRFIMAPMVHWPEVMLTYDTTGRILFSADAFGCFGALNGALFSDEVDFERDYLDEARRYYANIVGKYGAQVQAVLKKLLGLKIDLVCPLHGFVWRKGFGDFLSKYELWSEYEPEERGVVIAYASVYGNTENAAEILSSRLREGGVKTVMFDVSVTPASEIIAAVFKWSHLVLASTTYNAGIFVTMEAFVNDLVAHNIQKRTVAIIENGSWAAASGELMRAELKKCKNITVLNSGVHLKSAIKQAQLIEIEKLAGEITDTVAVKTEREYPASDAPPAAIDTKALNKLSYGLFVLTAKDANKDNGCIINTPSQISSDPLRISISVNKANHTHDMIAATGEFNISVLSESADFEIFKQFGFSSGRDTDKFEACGYDSRSSNGIRYIPFSANAFISAKVTEVIDSGSHSLFIADITEAAVLSGEKSVTYQYYFDHIKPKPQPHKEDKKGFVCKICGYVYEGDSLPADFICPLCKHGAQDFAPV
jgi:flavorubredoxin/flavin reductase (DIM6/NTAB) family NADH-FMN oxidoreductase RutF